MRIAILSDVHANLEALEAVLARADEDGVDATYVLGDIVGYNADPVAVIARLEARADTTTIAGNHDLAATGRFDTVWFNSTASAAIAWTREQLAAADSHFLDALEPTAQTDVALLVHGSVIDPAAEYINNAMKARDSFDAAPFSLCFFGHTHMPTIFSSSEGVVRSDALADGQAVALNPANRYLLNPGSVGQPRDGDPRASFMIYDEQTRSAVVHRVAYDIPAAQEKIRAAGLPGALADRLAQGR